MDLAEEGGMFYEYAQGALDLINNAENEFIPSKDLPKSEIKIGCSTTLTKLVLINPLKDFHLDYPNININIINGLARDHSHKSQIKNKIKGKSRNKNRIRLIVTSKNFSKTFQFKEILLDLLVLFRKLFILESE